MDKYTEIMTHSENRLNVCCECVVLVRQRCEWGWYAANVASIFRMKNFFLLLVEFSLDFCVLLFFLAF